MILRPHIIFAILIAVAAAGCASIPGSRSDIESEMAATASTPVKLPKPVSNEEAPIKITTAEKTQNTSKPEIEKGSGSFINEEAAKKPVAGVINEEGQITLNYENVPIQGVVQNILGALLKENYTIAPTVTGNVTFSTAKPITPAQTRPILEMLLSWTNNALIVKDGRYEVVPIKDALPGNLTPRMAPAQVARGYEARVFPLKYIAPVEMQKLLKPYAKPDAFVSVDNARNFIVMAGTASELANYQHSIEIFDVDWLKGMSVGVYGLRNLDVTKVMPDLEKIFGPTGESPLAGMFRFIPMETTNSVVVITPQQEYLRQAETWLYRLDAGVGENGTQLYVYDVKNVKAIDLSDHLNAIYTGQVSQRPSGGNVAPGLKPVSIGQFNSGNTGRTPMGGKNTQQLTEVKTPATSNLSTTGTGGAGGTTANGKQTDIRITAIEENNQLLVMATPGEWDSILAAIHRLDVSPLQVQIEAKILEVQLTGDLSYGVQWYLAGLIGTPSGSAEANGNYNYTYPPGSNNRPDFTGNSHDRHRASLGATGNVAPTVGGLFYSFLNKNMEVALTALQKNDSTKVLSAPTLVVMNNQEAQLTVGSQVSVISQSLYGINSNVNNANNNTVTNTGVGTASYISTGVTLDITPRVNPGGLVYMDVSQEDTIPNYSTTTAANPNPSIDQRNLKTQVAVQSGETVLLGGMIKDTFSDNRDGVPFLATLPVIGGLFGTKTKNHDRTELIVLITPRVITNPDEAREMTQEYQQKFESLKPLRAKQAEQPVEVTPVPPAPAPQPVPTQPEAMKSQESR